MLTFIFQKYDPLLTLIHVNDVEKEIDESLIKKSIFPNITGGG